MTDTPDPNRPDTDLERRLRAALTDRTRAIEPSDDGLQRIEDRLMNDTPESTNRNKWIIGASSVAAALLIGVVVFVATSDDDAAVVADSTSTTSSTTTEATTTTTTSEPTFTPDVDPFSVAYPSPSTSQRFDSPESAATSYATEVLGFTELEVVEYREGDSRSGEVAITDRPGRLETVVLVRQMDDDTWFVLGSQTEDIVVDTPSSGDLLAAPSFETSGTALAFEGTVDVFVVRQGEPAPLGEGFVTGSGVPPAGPFSGTVEFDAPGGIVPGIVIYRTLSAEDGHVTQATSFPVDLTAE